MFKGHRIVLFLPVTIMIILFIGGYRTIIQVDELRNEQLMEHVEFVATQLEEEILVQWQWRDYPVDGLRGEDYIILTFEEGANVSDNTGRISLIQDNEIIYEKEGFALENNSILYSFPNSSDTSMMGPLGQIRLEQFPETANEIQISYYHTWELYDHEVIDPSSLEESFQESGIENYWILNETVPLNQANEE